MGIAKRFFRIVSQPRGRHGDDEEQHPYEYAAVDEEESFSDGWYDSGDQNISSADVSPGRSRRARRSRRRRGLAYVFSSARNTFYFFCTCIRPVRSRSRHQKYTLPISSLLASLLRRFTLRRIALLVCTILVTLALGILSSGIPPSYSEYYEYERNLPQHNLELPPPEGEMVKFLRFPDHIWGHGLNNILQEVILSAHLAYLANRSYVFEPYTWSHTPFPYTIYDFALRPARIPLTAFISGPAGGGAMYDPEQILAGDSPVVPRAVSAEWYESLCGTSRLNGTVPGSKISHPHTPPLRGSSHDSSSGVSFHTQRTSTDPEERTKVVLPSLPTSPPDSDSLRKDPSYDEQIFEDELTGQALMDVLVAKLNSDNVKDAQCVELLNDPPVFSFGLFTSSRILTLWPSLSQSPVIKKFEWSALVKRGVKGSLGLFSTQATAHAEQTSESIAEDLSLDARRSTTNSHEDPSEGQAHSISGDGSSTSSSSSSLQSLQHPIDLPPLLPHVLALHLRRGDYVRHCPRLAKWRMGYQGFNQFEGLPDRFDIDGEAEEHGVLMSAWEQQQQQSGDGENIDEVKESEGKEEVDLDEEDFDIEAELELQEFQDEHEARHEKLRLANYMQHCWPSVDRIVQRVREATQDYHAQGNSYTHLKAHGLTSATPGGGSGGIPELTHIYILTNAFTLPSVPFFSFGSTRNMSSSLAAQAMNEPHITFLSQLTTALSETLGISPERILTSTDVERTLDNEQKYVSMAVDMAIAERVGVLIGNGFSSLTSNVVMLRTAKGFDIRSNRFW